MDSRRSAEVVIRYDGSTADSGRLSLFEAAESLEGTARVVNLITHAFVNNGEIRHRLTSPVGAATYLSAAHKGCFEESIDIEFGEAAVSKIKPSVIVGNFWDYFACCIAAAVGREYEPKTPMVRKILERTDAFFEEMAEALEAPLQNLHRPVKSKGALTITFARPKSGDILVLDEETLAYVSATTQSDELINWTGNVTKYNSLSGIGRIYIDQFGKTIPFRLSSFSDNIIAQRAAAASLNERVNEENGKRKIVGYSVINSAGTIKKLIIVEINRIF